MNRVARLTPTQAEGFKKLSGGESHGEYLTRTGNFGSPYKIVENEATKFTNSLKETDAALEQLPGVYKSDSVTTMLSDLAERELKIGVTSVKTPTEIKTGIPTSDTAKIQYLFEKNEIGGLNMAEINQVKRIYERTVKLGYYKERNTIGLERATRLDSHVRNWQVDLAESLGLKNLPELRKQTQLSKYIVNNLGKQLSGKVGNNAITLTDWIVLSGGDPTAIGAFFAKKIFLNKGFQAGVAKRLANKPFAEPIRAEITAPQTNRIVQPLQELSPTGLEKSYSSSITQAQKNASPLLGKENQVPPKPVKPTQYLNRAEAEADLFRNSKGLSAQDIMSKHPDIQLKRDVPATDVYGKKVIIPEGEALTPYELRGNKVLLQDGETYIVSKNQFQNIKGRSVVAGEFADVSPMAVEARKYKSAEEFVKAQFSKKPEYGMSHRPTYEDMPPSYNLLEGETLPRDVYTHPDFSIASGRIRSGDKAANESWSTLKKIKDNPDAEITIYRAGAKDKLNTGDWVTFSKEYAKQSVEGTEKVHNFKVKAKDVIFAGDDINEFGYYPKSQLTDLWKQAQKTKEKPQ